MSEKQQGNDEVEYQLTQFPSGHGCFQAYLERFKITKNPTYVSCGDNISQHAIYDAAGGRRPELW